MTLDYYFLKTKTSSRKLPSLCGHWPIQLVPKQLPQQTRILLEGMLTPAGLVSGLGCTGGFISLQEMYRPGNKIVPSEVSIFLPSILGPESGDCVAVFMGVGVKAFGA